MCARSGPKGHMNHSGAAPSVTHPYVPPAHPNDRTSVLPARLLRATDLPPPPLAPHTVHAAPSMARTCPLPPSPSSPLAHPARQHLDPSSGACTQLTQLCADTIVSSSPSTSPADDAPGPSRVSRKRRRPAASGTDDVCEPQVRRRSGPSLQPGEDWGTQAADGRRRPLARQSFDPGG